MREKNDRKPGQQQKKKKKTEEKRRERENKPYTQTAIVLKYKE